MLDSTNSKKRPPRIFFSERISTAIPILEWHLHLYYRQKCGDSILPRIDPSHILFDKSIEDSVAGTPRLELSEHEKEEIVETIGNPVECCESGKNYAEPGHVAHELAAAYRSFAIACVLTKYETVEDCESGHGQRSDGRHRNTAKQCGHMLFCGESEQRPPSHVRYIILILIIQRRRLFGTGGRVWINHRHHLDHSPAATAKRECKVVESTKGKSDPKR